ARTDRVPVAGLDQVVGQQAGLARRDRGDLAAPGALHQPVVLLVGYRYGQLGQHERDVVLDPVQPAQPRVVQHRVVGEVEQAAFVDRAHEDLEQRVLQGHHYLLTSASSWVPAITGSAAAGAGTCSCACRPSTTSTSTASPIPARRRARLPGLVGRCSWNSQVPAMMKYTLPVTLDTGTTIDARPACSAAWKSSIATAREPPST